MLRFLWIVAFTLDIASATSSLPPIAWGISYQLHSTNDLREWGAWVNKGARRFKIDFQLSPVDNTTFLFSHDIVNLTLTSYNTSKELLRLLQRRDFIAQLGVNSTLNIAMCFKAIPQPICDSNTSSITPEAQASIAAIDMFYEEAMVVTRALKSDFNITLEFVLDGSAKPTDCLAQRWRPWTSTWIIGDGSPDEAFLSDNHTLGYDRFTVLNNPTNYSNWRWMATPDVRYGKFSTPSHYQTPYQLWEPDAQREILDYQALYLNSTPPHPSGMRFAINIDPGMFEVFSASSTEGCGRTVAWDYQLDPKAKSEWQPKRAVTGPPPQYLKALTAISLGDVVVIVSECSENGDFYSNNRSHWCAVLGVPLAGCAGETVLYPDAGLRRLNFTSPTVLTDKSRLPGDLVSLVAVDKLPGSLSTSLALVTADGLISTLRVDHHGTSGARDSFSVSLGPPSHIAIAPSLGILGATVWTGRVKHRLVAAYRSGECAIGLAVVSFANDEAPIYSCLLVTSDQPVIAAHVALACVKVPESQDSLVAIVAAVIGPSVHASFTALGDCHSEKTTDLPAVIALHPSPLIPVGIGSAVRLASTYPAKRCESSTGDYVGMVVLDGRCDNSHHRNTQAFPRVCDAVEFVQASSDPYALDYTVGQATDWMEHLTLGGTGGGRISACHSQLLHGTLTLGQGALDVMLFPAREDGSKRLALGVLHGGYSTNTTSSCGTPLQFGGLVLNGLTLPGNVCSAGSNSGDPGTKRRVLWWVAGVVGGLAVIAIVLAVYRRREAQRRRVVQMRNEVNSASSLLHYGQEKQYR